MQEAEEVPRSAGHPAYREGLAETLLLIGSIGAALALARVAASFFAGTHQDLLVWCLVSVIASFAVLLTCRRPRLLA